MLAQLIKKFGRKKLIACEDDTLLLAIKYWLDEGNWNDFSDFEKFLELVGIDLPVTLSDYNWKNQSFKCQSAGRVVEISLQVADYNAAEIIDAEISVKEGDTVTTYTCLTNYTGKVKPSVGIPRRTTTQIKSI